MKNKKFIGPVYKESEAFILSNFYENNDESILYIGKDDIEKNSIEKSESLITLGLGYEWKFEKDGAFYVWELLDLPLSWGVREVLVR